LRALLDSIGLNDAGERLDYVTGIVDRAIDLVDRHLGPIHALAERLRDAGFMDRDAILATLRGSPDGRRLIGEYDAEAMRTRVAPTADDEAITVLPIYGRAKSGTPAKIGSVINYGGKRFVAFGRDNRSIAAFDNMDDASRAVPGLSGGEVRRRPATMRRA
jgi:hypothetical protein